MPEEVSSFDEDKIEYCIIKSLLEDNVYARNFMSQIKPKLFSYQFSKLILCILAYYKKYSKIPKISILEDQIIPKKIVDEKLRNDLIEKLQTIRITELELEESKEWLYDETKNFIRVRSIMNGIMECASKINKAPYDELVSIMEKSFKVTFDESFGLDYFDSLEERYERSKEGVEIIPTGLNSLDNAIGGGYRRKSMFVYAGPSNVGKTLCLNDAASTLALNGYNVLYLSMELSEDYVAMRTDAKFAQVSMNEINIKPEFAIQKAIKRRDELKKQNKKLGKLIYKEYGPNAVCANDIRGLLQNLELKAGFKPDFLVVDYIKLVRPNGKVFSDNTYGKLGTVCEELRAVVCDHNCCLLTAAQTGRQSYGAKSIGMEDVADSIAITQTTDVLITITITRELDNEDMMILNIAKSRFSRKGDQFIVNVDYNYMRLVDVDDDNSEISENTNENMFTHSNLSKFNRNEVKEDEDTQELDL